MGIYLLTAYSIPTIVSRTATYHVAKLTFFFPEPFVHLDDIHFRQPVHFDARQKDASGCWK